MSPRLRDIVYGVFVVIGLGALCWPGYAWFGADIEPWVLGVPFSIVWVVGWVALAFVALVLYDATSKSED